MKRFAFLVAAALVSTGAAHAQKWTGYAPVAVSIPKGSNDPSLTVFRAKVFELAQKKDKDALANLIARDFFWERDFGGGYDKKSNPVANFAQALSLDAKNNAGWRLLMSFVEQGTGPHATRRGVFCGPAEPKYDAKAFEKLLKATDSDVFEWSYPGYDAVVVRAKAEKDAPEIAKLGPHFVYTDLSARTPNFDPEKTWTQVITQDGKRGFVAPGELFTPLDPRLCYVKRGDQWMITGYIGGGD